MLTFKIKLIKIKTYNLLVFLYPLILLDYQVLSYICLLIFQMMHLFQLNSLQQSHLVDKNILLELALKEVYSALLPYIDIQNLFFTNFFLSCHFNTPQSRSITMLFKTLVIFDSTIIL